MADESILAPISVEQQKLIFRTLIEAQDGGASVTKSRADVLRRFAVSEAQLKEIEAEGMDNEWPPLG